TAQCFSEPVCDRVGAVGILVKENVTQALRSMARQACTSKAPAVLYIRKPHADTAQRLSQRSGSTVGCVEHTVSEWAGNDQVSSDARDACPDNFAGQPRHINRGQHRISRGGQYQITLESPRLRIECPVCVETRLEVVLRAQS